MNWNKINDLIKSLTLQTKKKDIAKTQEELQSEFIVQPYGVNEEGTASGYGYFLGV